MKPHNPVLPALVGGQPVSLALRFGELQRLEAEADTPLEKLFWAVSGGEGRLTEIALILRLGLLGGGLSEAEAAITAERWMNTESLIELRVVASSLLSHALRRASPDEVDFDALGKVQGEAGPSGAPSPEAGPTGPNTSATRRPRSRGQPKPSGS